MGTCPLLQSGAVFGTSYRGAFHRTQDQRPGSRPAFATGSLSDLGHGAYFPSPQFPHLCHEGLGSEQWFQRREALWGTRAAQASNFHGGGAALYLCYTLDCHQDFV